MLFYADRISENIRKREPEGYLICVNVPIARSGTQQYLKDEVGQGGDGMVTVYRPEEEVFSRATMASFEGMPVTNDHPETDEGVTADNIQWFQKGHCQNVRRGEGKDKNLLIADLVITDPGTIQEVLDGKREISCGYNYELCDENGKLVQRQIRGNHVAIVDKGRAGHRVCIKDSYPNKERRNSVMNKKSILAKMLAAFARDAEPDEIEEAVNAIDDLTTEEPKDKTSEKLDTIVDLLQNPPEKEEEQDEEPEEEKPVLTDSEEKLDTLIDLVKQLLAQKGADCKGKDEGEETDPLEKLEDDLDELEEAGKVEEEDEDEEEEDPEAVTPDEDPEEPNSKFVDPEEINGEEDEDEEELEETDEDEEEKEEKKPVIDKRARDAMRAAIKAVRPAIAKLPPSERRAAADAAVKSIRKSYGLSGKAKRNDYLALKSRKKAADRAAASRNSDAALGKKIMAKRNVNYKK